MGVDNRGRFKASDVVENDYYVTSDGAKFLKIYSHDLRASRSLFPNKASSTDQQLFTTSDNKFSRLKDMPLFQDSEGKYELLIKYPEWTMYSDNNTPYSV